MKDRPLQVLASPAFRNAALNPYTSLLYKHLPAAEVADFSVHDLLSRRHAIWHVHWPEMCLNYKLLPVAISNCAGFIGALEYARARGCRIVWTAHNLACHDHFHSHVEKYFWQAFLRRVDGIITLTHAGAAALVDRFPAAASLPRFVIPHGHYRHEYPETQTDIGQRLGIPRGATVLLHFGAIRAYKNVSALVAAFEKIDDPNLFLVIAGRSADDLVARRLRGQVADHPRIRLQLTHVPQQEVTSYFRLADLVVLPYTEIQNSGTALLSLTMQRPVMVPAKGGMPELRDQVGGEWVFTYDGDFSPSNLLHAIRWAYQPRRGPNLSAFDWEAIGWQTLRAYQTVLGAERVPLARSA